jgi:prepilin-type processing-associated H-X9-DG protein
MAALDTANKRIYYTAYNGSSPALYYADFSAGLGGVMVSSVSNVTDFSAGADWSHGSNFAFTDGHPSGRRLLFAADGVGRLMVLDIDNNTLRVLSVSGLPSTNEWWAFGYRAATNEVFITTKGIFGARCYRFTVPADPTNAGNYNVTMTQLSFAAGVAVESGQEITWQYGERSQYLPSLGVVLMTQRFGKMLAYRPS